MPPGRVLIRSLQGVQTMSRSTRPSRWLICAVGLLVCAAGATRATGAPIGAPLAPGQTLYVRFALSDMTGFPNPFNMLGTEFDFDQGYTGCSLQMAIYDDNDHVVGSVDLPSTTGTILGFGPTYADLSRGGRAGNPLADLGSFDDGMGMASYRNTGGPTVVISTFEAKFGQAFQFGAFYPATADIYGYAVDELPPAIPEPATLGMIACAGLAVLGRRRH